MFPGIEWYSFNVGWIFGASCMAVLVLIGLYHVRKKNQREQSYS